MKPCRNQPLVDGHFAGGLHPADERVLREHLPTCADCRRRYDGRLVLERVSKGAGAEARLGRGLGIRPRRRSWVGLGFAVGGVVAAAAILVVIRNPDSGFLARGRVKSPSLAVFVAGAQSPRRADGHMHAGDELAFAYENPQKSPFLMLFGEDEHHHLYWYYPGWTRADDRPLSVAISAAPGVHELGEAVAQPLDGNELRLTAWFLERPLAVDAAEALVRAAEKPKGAAEVVTMMKVERTP